MACDELRGRTLYTKVWLKHHHVWDSPFGSVTMYDITSTVELSFDPLNPYATADKTSICVDLPPQVGGGSICKSVKEIIGIIIAGIG